MSYDRSRFRQRTALVTGGASGIGGAIAERIHSEGGRVFIVDRDEAKLGDALRMLGPNAAGCVADVLEASAIQDAAAAAVKSFGQIDILINNAAFLDHYGAVTETTSTNWNQAIQGTLTSAFLFTSHLLPSMIARRCGCIVNVASVLGIVGKEGMSAYMAAKAGLIHLTRSIAIDYGTDGIRANAVCPAAIDTANNRRFTADPAAKYDVESQTVVGRLGRVEEVAAAVAFLASAESEFITGVALCVDGGWSLR